MAPNALVWMRSKIMKPPIGQDDDGSAKSRDLIRPALIQTDPIRSDELHFARLIERVTGATLHWPSFIEPLRICNVVPPSESPWPVRCRGALLLWPRKLATEAGPHGRQAQHFRFG